MGTLHEDQYIFFLSYLAHWFLEDEIFLTKVVEKNKTHIFYPINFSKIVLFMR